jgi:hypothetical protein
MKNYLLILILSLLIISCVEEKKTEISEVKKSIKKEEYVEPVNRNYDSISGAYKPGEPFDSVQFDMGCIAPGSRSFICLNNVPLMKDSSLKVPVGLNLNIGDSVRVEYYINTGYIHENWEERVYKVSVTKNGKEYNGYLLQSAIAIIVENLSDNKKLMMRVTGFEKDKNSGNNFIGEIIVLDSTNKVMDKNSYQLVGGEPDENNTWHYYYSVFTNDSAYSTRGINGALDIIGISMMYPACGYMGGEMLFVWDGKKLHNVLQNDSQSDAGVYNMSSYTIFPGEKGGKENAFISITNTVVYEYNEKDEYKELEHDSLAIQYSWEKDKGIVKTDTLFSNSK